jgi:hypothetical protein
LASLPFRGSSSTIMGATLGLPYLQTVAYI